MPIKFFNDQVKFNLKNKRKISAYLKDVIAKEGKKIGELNYVFVSDEVIIDINNKYLQHNYPTDIITFDNSIGSIVAGEMYISIDTVKFNANDYKVEFYNELLRVILHGVLHLCGHKDATAEEQKQMRQLEDEYLQNFFGV
jgi:rRNA maturation RNase YbeY